jgi:type IV secretion system protein VirB10
MSAPFGPTSQDFTDSEGDSRLVEPRRRISPVVLFAGASALAVVAAVMFWPASAPQTRQAATPLSDTGEVTYREPPPLPAEEVIQEMPVDTSLADDELARERQLRLDAEDAQRRAEAEKASLEAEKLAREQSEDARRWERLRSPMIVSETASLDIEVPPVGTAEAQAAGATFDEGNSAAQFLASRSSQKVETAQAETIKRPDAIVVQGTIIRGVLETALNSDLPGMVRASVVEDVWSYDGRRVLIPSGSRLIGEYNSGLEQGQKRVFVVWTRLVRPDGLSVSLGSPGTDELGRTGVSGYLDTHDFERFGTAFLMSVLGAGAQIAVGASGLLGTTPGNTTVTRINPQTGQLETVTTQATLDPGAAIMAKGVSSLAEGLASSAQEVLKSKVAIAPTITLHQGAPIAVSVRKDLDFSAHYPDPVMEKYRQLLQQRSGSF